jgi:hypothetical protein
MAAGYQVLAVNPMSVSHHRDRHAVSGAGLIGGVRRCWRTWSAPAGTTTGAAAGDSDLAEAVKALARAHLSFLKRDGYWRVSSVAGNGRSGPRPQSWEVA